MKKIKTKLPDGRTGYIVRIDTNCTLMNWQELIAIIELDNGGYCMYRLSRLK